MVNKWGIVLIIIVVVFAFLVMSSTKGAGEFIGGGKKSDEAVDSSGSNSYKDIQNYTVTEDGNFARASWNDINGSKSLLVLYNNGTRDKDGKLTQGDVQISFKIEDALDKENAKLDNVDKLSARGKALLSTAIGSLKSRFDAKMTKILSSTLDFLKL